MWTSVSPWLKACAHEREDHVLDLIMAHNSMFTGFAPTAAPTAAPTTTNTTAAPFTPTPAHAAAAAAAAAAAPAPAAAAAAAPTTAADAAAPATAAATPTFGPLDKRIEAANKPLVKSQDLTKPCKRTAASRVRAALASAPPESLRALAALLGEAVQLDPIKPTLKAQGTKGLKLKYVKNCFQFASILLSISTCAATARARLADRRGVRAGGGRRAHVRVRGRGSHSFTSQLNVSLS